MTGKTRAALTAGAVILGGSGVVGLVSGMTGIDTPWTLNVVFAIVGVTIYNGLAGNRRVPVADADDRARALRFEPASGGALLVLYRRGFNGRAVGVNARVDGREVAQLVSPRFTTVSLTPGQHEIAADCPAGKGVTLPVEVAAGQVLFVRIGMGWGKLRLEPQADGREIGVAPYVVGLGQVFA